jgi:hypothetical protein
MRLDVDWLVENAPKIWPLSNFEKSKQSHQITDFDLLDNLERKFVTYGIHMYRTGFLHKRAVTNPKAAAHHGHR